MQQFTVSIEVKEYFDYTVQAESAEKAIELAVEATDEREVFETLTIAKEGIVILDDAGAYGPNAVFVSAGTVITEGN